jgi:predicted DNA-binding transcriptional regulator AlpA
MARSVTRAAAKISGGDDPYNRMLEDARRRSDKGPMVSIKNLAAELGVSVRTLRRWNKRPDAPPRVKAGRRHMYRRADVERWVEQARAD